MEEGQHHVRSEIVVLSDGLEVTYLALDKQKSYLALREESLCPRGQPLGTLGH